MGSKVLYAWQVVLSCPSICPPLSAIATMAPLPSEDITPGMEEQIKELLESYRPVRQWTVRSETTKDKAGALPPAVLTLFNPPVTCLKKTMYNQRMQYHNAL